MAADALSAWVVLLPILIFVVVIPAASVLVVLPFWFICRKAGFPGALSLLMLVPVANIVLPFFLAFAEWPVLKGAGPDTAGPSEGEANAQHT